VGAGSTAAIGLRRTEVGAGLPAKWRGLEFRNWGLVELRNCELSNRRLPGVLGLLRFPVSRGGGLYPSFD
jgi:hypothetical protein